MNQVKFSARSATSVAVAILCLGASATAFAQVEAKVTGRVHFDARNFSNNYNAIADRDTASVGDSFEVRRARIGIAGSINKDIGYEVVGNAVGGTTNFVDTAWGNYGFNKKPKYVLAVSSSLSAWKSNPALTTSASWNALMVTKWSPASAWAS